MDSSFDDINTAIKSRGSSLILVLVFALLINVIVIFSLESSLLQQQIARNYQYLIENIIETESLLIKREQDLIGQTIESEDEEGLAQFIPDTLNFGEKQGINFYPIIMSQEGRSGTKTCLQSMIAKRRLF